MSSNIYSHSVNLITLIFNSFVSRISHAKLNSQNMQEGDFLWSNCIFSYKKMPEDAWKFTTTFNQQINFKLKQGDGCTTCPQITTSIFYIPPDRHLQHPGPWMAQHYIGPAYQQIRHLVHKLCWTTTQILNIKCLSVCQGLHQTHVGKHKIVWSKLRCSVNTKVDYLL